MKKREHSKKDGFLFLAKRYILVEEVCFRKKG